MVNGNSSKIDYYFTTIQMTRGPSRGSILFISTHPSWKTARNKNKITKITRVRVYSDGPQEMIIRLPAHSHCLCGCEDPRASPRRQQDKPWTQTSGMKWPDKIEKWQR